MCWRESTRNRRGGFAGTLAPGLSCKQRRRGNGACDWLLRLRALKNLQVIQSTPAAAGGDHDFSRYGVQQRFLAGREAVTQHFAQGATRHGPLRVAA